jgi:MoxR-like ATPase
MTQHSPPEQLAQRNNWLSEAQAPRWIKDVLRFLPLKSQFMLTGNLHDRFLPPNAQPGAGAIPLGAYIVRALSHVGYGVFLRFDPLDGFSLVERPSDSAILEFLKNKCDIQINEFGNYSCSLERAGEILRKLVGQRERLAVVIFDYASRYTARADSLSEDAQRFFFTMLKLSHAAAPFAPNNANVSSFNTLFWLANKENDLPGWLTIDNPRLRQVTVPRPDTEQRRRIIETASRTIPGYEACDNDARPVLLNSFVDRTNGLLASDIHSIVQLSRREDLSFSDIGEAVRRFKLGVIEDPWKRLDREKISHGEEIIGRRVKGQNVAVQKAMDIIKRAVTGLSGAQGSRLGGRPRGVLFLAGPTGTGKTELAKTLTEMLFGDEQAYIRFDMSEFSAEHADQRLLGAPPGYVGYDAGGELTNAIKERPFAVVLFDEIEKAHPRILDKFLQLLDDGVLTSGRGERVYFSEAVIVFTSNLGIYQRLPDGSRKPNVKQDDPPEKVESEIRREIERYFKEDLNRPEILNRIGENIVVFDFIRPPVAKEIFNKMVAGIQERLNRDQKITLHISDTALAQLWEHAQDRLDNGGRGIGNQLEARLVNPLARALFDADVRPGSAVLVTACEVSGGVPVVLLECPASLSDLGTPPPK